MSWDDLNEDKIQEKNQEIAKEESEKAADFQACFATPKGKKVLAHLRAMTIEQPSLPEAAADGVALAMLMSIKEGEKNLVRRIESLIKSGGKL